MTQIASVLGRAGHTAGDANTGSRRTALVATIRLVFTLPGSRWCR